MLYGYAINVMGKSIEKIDGGCGLSNLSGAINRKARDDMTESEALEKLEAHIECESKRSSVEGCNEGCIDCELAYLQGTSKEHIESVKIAIQALEKQMPKKPTLIDYEKYINVIDNAKFLKGAFWCPNCKHVVHSGSF